MAEIPVPAGAGMNIIGIDGGGTKTKFTLFNESGEIVSETSGPSCHVLQSDKETAIHILREGIKQLNPRDVSLISAGLAGYGQNPLYRKKIEEICDEAFDTPYILHSDLETAFEGALDGRDGIVVIAGTGSIACSRKDGKTRRCGGWGMNLGDEGSAWHIAKMLLNEFTKQSDGRKAKTVLYEMVRRALNLKEDYELIAVMNDTVRGSRTETAKLAKTAYEAALAGDEAALSIYRRAADEIANMIKTLQEDFGGETEVSYIGGVFQAQELILDPLRAQLKNCTLQAPVHKPEFGAYLLAKHYLEQNND